MNRLLEIPRGRLLKKILGFDEIYTICYRKKGSKTLFEGDKSCFTPISYSKEYWYADPLGFEWNGQVFVFVEQYDRLVGKGCISVCNPKEDDWEFRTIIQEKYHMSFPMVFEWNHRIFMIPETSANRSINIYEAKEFPYIWEKISEIPTEAKCVDPVITEVKKDSITIMASELSISNLMLARYKKYRIDYENLNRIVCLDDDISTPFTLFDRNAGTIIQHGDRKILPVQVSSECDYGIEIRFKECDSDNTTEIAIVGKNDIVIDGIDNNCIIGVHTYSCVGDYEIIDARYLKFSPFNQYRKIMRGFRKND